MHYFGKSLAAMLLSGTILLSISCKKVYTDIFQTVYTDTVQIQAYNHLVSFVIYDTVNKDTIQASLTADSIIVYWPIWKTRPEKIAPRIVLPAKATISPALGDSVLFKNDITYTVTAQSGLKKTYTLKVIEQQQPFYFRMNGTSFRLGATVYFNGDYFMRGLSTRIFLEEIGGTRQFELADPQLGGDLVQISAVIPTTVDTALYRVRLEHGTRSAYDSEYDTIQVGYGVPSLTKFTAIRTVKRGETFTVTGSNIALIDTESVVTYDGTNGPKYPLIVESYTLTSITFRVPATTPAGNYGRYDMKGVTFNFGFISTGWASSTSRYLKVTE